MFALTIFVLLLFLLRVVFLREAFNYINDAPSFVSMANPNCEIFLYADDAKLFSNNAFSLQQGLDKFTDWLQLHQLDLAVAKCEHLCIFCIHCCNSFFAGSLGLNVKTVSVVKDLGIYISNNHKWSYHISHIHQSWEDSSPLFGDSDLDSCFWDSNSCLLDSDSAREYLGSLF